MKEFKNRNEWALILGGSSGLGLATAKKLAKHGLNVCIAYRSPRAQEEQILNEFEFIEKENVRFISFNIDITRAEKRQVLLNQLKETFGDNHKLKVLVHSIAKGNLKPMVSDNKNELKHDDFEITFNAMALSLYDWTKALFEQKFFSDDARIISFTSEGNTKAWQNYAAVSVAKVSLEAITRNIALELAPFGIKANCIQAGVTDTASLRLIPESEDIIAYSKKRNPNNRLTTPEDVANAVYLLVKDEASWITGTIIPVDGGEHLR